MGRRREKKLLGYVLDSREQFPYALKPPDQELFENGGSYCDALEAGDITAELDFHRLSIVIERKQHADFIGCCRHDRGCEAFRLVNDPACGARCRFERELTRLSSYTAPHIIIEAPFAMLRAGHQRSHMNGLSVVNSMASWALKFPTVHFWTVSNHREGELWAWTLINLFAKYSLAEGSREG